jgi:hypothetical protein
LQLKIKLSKENREKGENYLISLCGAIPRKSLIRSFLLMLFPNGYLQISLRKINRAPLTDLIQLIGENLIIIKVNLSNEKYRKWLWSCYLKLSEAQRSKKNDLIVLKFAISFLNQKSEE